MNKNKNKLTKINGTISITSTGTGYVSNNLTEDVYISYQLLNTALHGDEVEIVIYPRIKGEKLKGEVLKVISRKKTFFVGTVERRKNDKFAFISTDDHRMYVPIFIPDAPKEAKNNIKVLAEITKWSDPRKNPSGKILKIIGLKGDNDVEMESIVIEKGFEVGFPKEVEREAQEIQKNYKKVIEQEISKRRDFRKTLTFTIDPDDAKDFDDAVSFKKIDNETFEVGVHIADVSFWVKPKSSLDKESKKRGFSLYLVDRTIPMLPEILSNDICSLNPREDKLTFSAVFNITIDGKIKKSWFGRTVINSDKRFTYKGAQEIIDGKEGDCSYELRTLTTITEKLRKQRVENGALDIGHDEVEIELDGKGFPVRIYVKKGIDTQRLIEELMVLANKESALLTGGKDNKGLCMFRIHERPDKDSLNELFNFLKKLGHDVKLSGHSVSSKDLNSLLKQLKDKDEEFLVKSVVVKSLPKAIYSIDNKGHYAMALRHYAHFTSPIRRYADLLVHRVVEKKLNNKKPTDHDKFFYKETANDLSKIEINLASAERASIALKQVEFMLSKVGETRQGIISGITDWGIYVQEIETRSEGMVRLREMKDDFYILDKETFSITGSRTKKKYSLGDKVKIKVVGGDIEKKTLDYSFA